MTWKELKTHIEVMNEEQVNTDVTFFDKYRNRNEFFRIKSIEFANPKTCDVLDPCGEYEPSSSVRLLNSYALKIKDKRMSFEEHRFINSATTLLFFTIKQELWLRGIYKRLKNS